MGASPGAAQDPLAAREELERILASTMFARAPFAQRFLRYIVEAELSGRSADIKEYRIGVDVFDRGDDFDPKADTVVRVEGVRLRKRLEEYYAGPGAGDPIQIDMPKGSYRATIGPRSPVAAVVAEPVEQPPPAAVDAPPLPRRARGWLRTVLVVLVVIAGSVAYLLRGVEPLCSWVSDVPCRKNIAVLPFRAVGDDPRSRAIAEGLLYVLTGKLSELEGVREMSVVPASDVVVSGITSSGQARRSLGANLVLTGSVELSGDNQRVTISLTDTEKQRQISSRTLDFQGTDTVSLQDQVLLAATDMLRIEMRQDVQQILAAGASQNTKAQDFYIQGRGHLEKGRAGADDAIAQFQEALDRDPNYALAKAGKAEAFRWKYFSDRNREWLLRAADLAKEARDLDPKLPEAWIAAGVISMELGQIATAGEQLRRAIQLAPRNSRAYQELAKMLERNERVADAEATFRKAIGLRPDYWGPRHELGRFLMRQSRFAEAEAVMREAVSRAPENPIALAGLGDALVEAGKDTEAVPIIEHALLVQPTPSLYVTLAACFLKQRQYPRVVAELEKAVTLSPAAPLPLYYLGQAYRLANQPSRAQETFVRAEAAARQQWNTNGSPAMRALMALDLAELNRSAEALREIEAALRQAAANVTVLLRAVGVFERTGNRERALETVAKLPPQEISGIRADPDLSQLVADPRFKQGPR